jgi:hypothetical protein
MWVWRSSRWEACAFLLQVYWSVRAAHEILRPFWRNVSDSACVCSFELWIYSFLGFSSHYHRFWDQCIPESRLIQTPQICVRFSFNFRHWLILFHQPIAISQSSNKERLDCKVTWHMTCIFQQSSVETGLEDTHSGKVSGRQHARWLRTTHKGHNLQAFQRAVHNPHDVALQGRMHVTYWSNARQHACCRRARRPTFVLHVAQDAFSAHQNNRICSMHMLCINVMWTLSKPLGWCVSLLASLSGADNQNMQDAGCCA